MDPLKPICVRLKTSTIEAIRKAQEQSHHRTMASFVDALLREQLIIKPAQQSLDQRLRLASAQSK